MQHRKEIKSTDTNRAQEGEVILSLDYSFTLAAPEGYDLFEVPPDYRTVPVGPEETPESETSVDSKVIHSRIVTIEDPRFEETYTAYVTRTSTGWSGRIPDVLEVNRCKEDTRQALLKTLKDNLYEALKARSDAWDKQIEEDIEAGRLDHLREEILEDIEDGRLTDL